MPNKYQHNSERWLRNQAKIYTRRDNAAMDFLFEQCADDVAALRNAVSKLQAEAEILRGMGHDADVLREVLREAKLQIEYLHGKFKETGSGNGVLARIDAVLGEK